MLQLYKKNKKFNVSSLLWALVIIGAILVGSEAGELNPANQVTWRYCDSKDEMDQTTKTHSTNLQVYVTGCIARLSKETNPVCRLQKGTNPLMTMVFTTNMTVPNVERIIMAKVPSTVGIIEMPHGPSVSICDNAESTISVSDRTNPCVESGVVAKKTYTYVSSFKVLKSFPLVSGVSTKIILRESFKTHRKLSKYRQHPGPTILCYIIPNIEVTE